MFDVPNPFERAAGIVAPALDRIEWWEPNPNDDIPGRARQKQRPPDMREHGRYQNWYVWLLMSGRGFGKTRTGAEWIDYRARRKRPGEQVLVAGRTPADVRTFALEGPGGLLTNHPDVEYISTQRKLVWPNGVLGMIRSGANPEEFRGFSGDTVWLDEFAAWDYPQRCWENLMFGVREANPRICITTTPRPLATIKAIMELPDTVTVIGSSRENRQNLSEQWIRNILDPLRGTRLERQEVEGELLWETPGALWTLEMLDGTRVGMDDLPDLVEVAVGVDPQGVKDVDAALASLRMDKPQRPDHETGIVVAAVGEDGHLYILDDASINGSPIEWGTRTVATFDRWEADRIVGEKNYGGEMVEHVVRTVRRDVSYTHVNASRGKAVRAEPVSALFERGKAHHVGTFPALEDEMATYVPGEKRQRSPNRLDAMVWAATRVLKLGDPVPIKLEVSL